MKVVSASGAPPPNPRFPWAAGGYALRPPALLFPPTIMALLSYFLALNAFYSPR